MAILPITSRTTELLQLHSARLDDGYTIYSMRMAGRGKRSRGEVIVVAERSARRDWLVHAVSVLGFNGTCMESPDESNGGCTLVILNCDQDLERSRNMCSTTRHLVGKAGVLAITQERSSLGRAKLLEAGADLVLAERFASRELFACVRALTWRAETPAKANWLGTSTERADDDDLPSSDHLVVAGVSLNQLASLLHLTETERLLLRVLSVAHRPIATAQLVEAVFPGAHYPPDSSHLRVHMHRLRKKLVGAGLSVKGLHGRGYRLIEIRPNSAGQSNSTV